MITPKSRSIGPYLLSGFFVLLCLGQTELRAQEPQWYSLLKQIKIFETDRATVESMLEGAEVTKSERGQVGLDVRYTFRNDFISVLYSNGYCSNNIAYGYNIPTDIVIGVGIRLRKPVPLSRFDFDLRKFKKEEIEDIVGAIIYTNKKEGIRISGSATYLQGIVLEPTSEQKKRACENFIKN